MYGIIYCIFNSINGKMYIGQTTVNLNDRWRGHNRKDSTCIKLRRAIIKYGKNNFIISKLIDCNSQNDLDGAEQYWINYFDSIKQGYNCRSGGHGGGRLSAETRQKISASMKGQRHSLGNKQSEQLKLLRSILMAGKVTKYAKLHSKSIVCNETGVIFDSIHAASKILGIDRKTIGQVLRGKFKQASGYTFGYLET